MAEPNTLNMMTDTTDYASIQSFDAPSHNPKRPFKNILLTRRLARQALYYIKAHFLYQLVSITPHYVKAKQLHL